MNFSAPKPLTLERLKEIQSDAMADDMTIDFGQMRLWTEQEAATFFESGGEDAPAGYKKPEAAAAPDAPKEEPAAEAPAAPSAGCVIRQLHAFGRQVAIMPVAMPPQAR